MNRAISYLLIIFTIIPVHLFAQVDIGVYLGEAVPTKDGINAFEDLIGKDISSVLFYQGWNSGNRTPFPSLSFLNDNVRYHDGYDTGTTLHVTMEPFVGLTGISGGFYDNYLRSYATSVKQWGGEVRFRFAHEMIQDNDSTTLGWYPWQDKPEEYVAAYQHVYNIFKNEVQTDNVKFIWSPNHHIFDKDILAQYYPGQEYVDLIGIDGYNFGYSTESQPFGYWATFDDIFYDIYQSFIQNKDIFGDKPIMLSEFASAEGDLKDEWILEALQKIKDEYGEVEALYWFNTDKERDWRIDSSPESLAAFRQAIGQAYFTTHPGGGGGYTGGSDVDPGNIPISATIPPISTLRISVSKIEDDDWQPAGSVDFGNITYDPSLGIFLGKSYYAIDVGIISNQPPWVVTHTTSSVTNGRDNLDNNINVAFVKQSGADQDPISTATFQDSNGTSFNNAIIDSESWLRIYYGIATGRNDAPGAAPITVSKSSGTYTGSVTLTLTNM